VEEKEERTLVKEQPHQEKAFEYYYALGTKRSYEKVASKFGVSLGSVKLWGKSFNWADRLQEREAQVARELATRAINDEVSRRERSLQIVQLALVQLAKAIAEGKVRMTLGDLDKLIRLEAFLNDLPDARQEIVFGDLKNKSSEELREMMREEIETLKKLEAHEREVDQWQREGKLLTARTEKGEQDDKDEK
jgi:hypothetical protein